jgi:hypothetical protein
VNSFAAHVTAVHDSQANLRLQIDYLQQGLSDEMEDEKNKGKRKGRNMRRRRRRRRRGRGSIRIRTRTLTRAV